MFKAWTRARLEARLRALATSEPPSVLQMGAMCYSPRLTPTQVEYVCAHCGGKTLYAVAPPALQYVQTCRRMLSDIKELQPELDERELCASCCPTQPEAPRLVLLIRDGDGRELRTVDIIPNDLRLLSEVLGGGLVHRNMHDYESPLREHQQRIRTLLGLDTSTKDEE